MGLPSKLVGTAVGLTSFAAGWWSGCSSFKVFSARKIGLTQVRLVKRWEVSRDSRVGKEVGAGLNP